MVRDQDAFRAVGGRVAAVAWSGRYGQVSSPCSPYALWFGYYPYRHTGATAWYLLAAARANPLR